MKAILEFKLPEEKGEFLEALNAYLYKQALEEISDFLVKEHRYELLNEVEAQYLEKIRTKFYQVIKDLPHDH